MSQPFPVPLLTLLSYSRPWAALGAPGVWLPLISEALSPCHPPKLLPGSCGHPFSRRGAHSPGSAVLASEVSPGQSCRGTELGMGALL